MATGSKPVTHDDIDAAVRMECRMAFGGLTAAEREVLVLIAKGHTMAEVARLTGRTMWTVGGHCRRLHGKLGVSTNIEAAVIAAKAGAV